MELSQSKLLLVGCGKMGGALLAGWLKRGLTGGQVTVVDPNPAALDDFAGEGITLLPTLGELPQGYEADLVLLAVKPQFMDEVMPRLANLVRPETVFLSIAAGKTLAYFQSFLGDEAAIVRSMPNTPAAVARGMTVLFANDKASPAQAQFCAELLAAVGEVAWLDSEEQIDAVTALSGGGPAYVFLLIETMAKAGEAAGLPPELSMTLARTTVAGAGELVHQASESAEQLRKNVTSPAGTTLEALTVLMAEEGLQPLMTKAIAAATARSKELSS